jgi:hypothetical protein
MPKDFQASTALVGDMTRSRHRGRAAAGIGAALAVTAAIGTLVPGAAFAAGEDKGSRTSAAVVDERMFAVIQGKSGGVAQNDGHVLTSQRLGNGLDGRLYRITFDRDIRDCAYFATPTAVGSSDLVNADTGIAIRQNRSFATRQVLDVITKDGGLDLIENDSSFSLLVECRPAGA